MRALHICYHNNNILTCLISIAFFEWSFIMSIYTLPYFSYRLSIITSRPLLKF